MRRSQSRIRTLFLAAATTATLAACGDSPTGPAAALVTLDAEAALRIALELPTLPRLVDELATHAPEADSPEWDALHTARALWLDAVELEAAGDPAADSVRAVAFTLAAPALARTLEPRRIRQLDRMLDRWIGEAEIALGHAGSADIAKLVGVGDRMDDARRLRRRAEHAIEQDDLAGAILALLGAADRLAATTPPAVARRLILRSERLLAERAEPPARPLGDTADTTSGVDTADTASNDEAARQEALRLERAARLLRGAHEAFESRDYARAIRRAYYAGQLAELR